jgi:YebC/PmpR family DNA-binding regulatory protein
MSGHSHWSKVKWQKGATDLRRSKAFSKMARLITIAAREGRDPTINSKLRLAIEMAKRINMSSENIERAIKRGAGEVEGTKLEPVIFEAYGPGGIAILIEGITDNKNRALNEVKQILNQNNGKLVAEGSVKWLFERKGVITIVITNDQTPAPKEDLEMLTIEAGAEDIRWKDDVLDIYTKIGDLDKVKRNLENQGIKIESASLDWVAKEEITLREKERENCQKLFEALDEVESVQEIYSNLKE